MHSLPHFARRSENHEDSGFATENFKASNGPCTERNGTKEGFECMLIVHTNVTCLSFLRCNMIQVVTYGLKGAVTASGFAV